MEHQMELVHLVIWKNPNSPHGDWELPELTANGTSVSFNSQNRGSGTSYASPAVAGTALLLKCDNYYILARRY